MTVQAELDLEDTAKKYVLNCLGTSKSPARPGELVTSSAKSNNPIPAYAIRRAVWTLVVDGKAEFTPDNQIRLRNS